jgi:hypothetical protein
VWEMNWCKESRRTELSVLNTIKRRKANWIGHILRRNCLLEHVIWGKIRGRIEVMRRRGRRVKQLLYDLKEMRGYYKLEKEALARTLWRIRYWRDYGTVGRHTKEWTTDDHNAWINNNIGVGETCQLNQMH